MRDDLLAVLVVLAARAKLGQRTDLKGIDDLSIRTLGGTATVDMALWVVWPDPPGMSLNGFHLLLVSPSVVGMPQLSSPLFPSRDESGPASFHGRHLARQHHSANARKEDLSSCYIVLTESLALESDPFDRSFQAIGRGPLFPSSAPGRTTTRA